MVKVKVTGFPSHNLYTPKAVLNMSVDDANVFLLVTSPPEQFDAVEKKYDVAWQVLQDYIQFLQSLTIDDVDGFDDVTDVRLVEE